MEDSKRNKHCSFCQKPITEIAALIAGEDIHICNECITLCKEIIADDRKLGNSKKAALENMYPKQIKAFLDERVIGQERAKRALSVAVYNHYKRVREEIFEPDEEQKNIPTSEEEVELTKGNILLIGPTGSGKTLIAKSIAEKLDVPFTISDATSLTEAGYVGEDVENIIKNLWIAADRNAERASHGIVCIDEIDKLGSRSSSKGSRDVGGEGVQQALLKMVESTKVTVTPDSARNRPQTEVYSVDTTNILFICCGSFSGLSDLIAKRLGKSQIGFGAEKSEKIKDKDILRHVRPSDLNQFGLIPEFIGRFPVIVSCDELSEGELVEILWKPKNSLIAQYQKLLEIEGVKLHFEHSALLAMVRKAAARNTGARGLRSIIEEVMLDIMFEIPELKDLSECIVTEDCVTQQARPILRFENEELAP